MLVQPIDFAGVASRASTLRKIQAALAFGVLLGGVPLLAQNGKPTTVQSSGLLTPASIPNSLRPYLAALGDHLENPGKERTILQGTINIGGSSSAAQVVIEIGGKVNLVAQGRTVKFNGNATPSGASQADLGIVQSLAEDTADALMEALHLGTGARLVGLGFPDPDGGQCDLYDVPMASRAKPGTARSKRYCFDPGTGLLRWVSYPATPGANNVVHETHFSDWRMVDGQAIPGRITRIEAGASAFTLQADSGGISVAPKSDDSLFN